MKIKGNTIILETPEEAEKFINEHNKLHLDNPNEYEKLVPLDKNMINESLRDDHGEN